MKRNNNNIYNSRAEAYAAGPQEPAAPNAMEWSGQGQRCHCGETSDRATAAQPPGKPGKVAVGAATTVPVPVPVRGGALHADDGSVRSSELEEQQKATPSCLFPPRSLAPPAPAASSCMPVPVPVLLRCNKTAQRALCSLGAGWLAAAVQRSAALCR